MIFFKPVWILYLKLKKKKYAFQMTILRTKKNPKFLSQKIENVGGNEAKI